MVGPTQSAAKLKETWIPDRQEIIWINCNPQAGNKIRDLHPFLVLSPRIFNERTSLVIGLPMTTAQYNADNPFAVAIGTARGKKSESICYVLCHQPKSFDWRSRKATPHPLKRLADGHFAECCARLNQIVQLAP
jgi:mRNA interferase MazF